MVALQVPRGDREGLRDTEGGHVGLVVRAGVAVGEARGDAEGDGGRDQDGDGGGLRDGVGVLLGVCGVEGERVALAVGGGVARAVLVHVRRADRVRVHVGVALPVAVPEKEELGVGGVRVADGLHDVLGLPLPVASDALGVCEAVEQDTVGLREGRGLGDAEGDKVSVRSGVRVRVRLAVRVAVRDGAAEAEPVAPAVGDTVGVVEEVALGAAVREGGEGVPEQVRVGGCVADTLHDPEGLLLRVPLRVGAAVGVGVGVRVGGDGERVAVAPQEAVPVARPVALRLRLWLPVEAGVAEAEAGRLPVRVRVAEPEGGAVGACERVPLGVGLRDSVAVRGAKPLPEAVRVAVEVRDGTGLGLGVAVQVLDCEGERGDCVTMGRAVAVAVAVSLRLREGGLRLRLRVGVPEAVEVWVGARLRDRETVGVGVPVGLGAAVTAAV